MPLDTWLAFAGLWIAFAAFPGPNAAYAMAVGSRRGAAAALAAAAGFSAAVACYVTMAAFGLIAFLAASAELFEILRWVGVAYLFFLAWQSWRAPTDPATPPRVERREAGGIALKAALISLTNPKSALTYVMLYPPFMSAAGPQDATLQLVILGTTSVVISFANYAVYGLAAGRVGRLIRTARQARLRNRAFAAIFAGAGIALAWAGRR